MDFNITVISLITAVITLLYYLTTKKFNYWKKKNVPHLKPIPLFGNFAEYILLQKCQAKVSQELCRKFPKVPYFGYFYGTEPTLVIQDPEIIKLVFTKDFYYFNSRELMNYSDKELIHSTMFFNYGDDWKIIRQNVTPLFTTARLRNMFYLIEKCTHALEKLLDYETASNDVLHARNLMIRYTMDCICTCSFGVEAMTLDKDGETSPFAKIGREIFGASYYRGFKTVARAIWPNIFYGFGLTSFPPILNDFFGNLITGVFQSRGYKPSQRNDFVDLILNFKNTKTIVGESLSSNNTGGSKKVELVADDALMISQCIGFFGAGFETSAGALSLTIYELAKNVPAQRRAQKEVDEYLLRHNNKLEYDCVKELPFLEACVYEALRLYPVLPIITREVTEDYTFPSGLRLEKGIRVHLPVFHMQRSEEIFPDAEQYKPERFLPDEGHTIDPYTFFPFGEGPRTCIGKRFSKMQVFPGLITVLKKFNVELAEGTPETLEFETTTYLLQPASTLAVKVTKRDGWENRVYAK